MGGADGIEVRATSIRLFFVWNGERRKETFTVNGKPIRPTNPNIAYARIQAAEIKKRIEAKTFVLSEFFPDSKHVEATGPGATFGQVADEWLKTTSHLAAATKDQYRNGVEMWKTLLGKDRPMADMSSQFIKTTLGEHGFASARSFNNYMIPLRGVFAFHFGPVSAVSGIANRKRVKKKPDPLSLSERDRILADMKKHYTAPIWAYFQFAFYAGMRPEELIALQWGDLDMEAATIRVQRVRTFRGSERDGTKTGGERDVDLVEAALEALEAMRPITGDRFDIFLNPNTGRSWHDERSQRDHYWYPSLKRLGIRKRRAYCCRHTYCSGALNRGVNPAYIASQAGHNLGTLLKDYARWIPDGGKERSKLEEAPKVPQEFPNDISVIGRRDWTRTNPKGKT